MKTSVPRSRISFLALVILASISAANGAEVLYEGFNYGGSTTSLGGLGTAGSGWGGSWNIDVFTYTGSPTFAQAYQPGGLSFSDLVVTGGNAYLSASGDGFITAYRTHTATVVGTLYGSYLFQTPTPTSGGLYSLFEGGGPDFPSGFSQFAAEPIGYSSSNGGVIMNNGYTYASGTPISANETYLMLYEVTGLGPTTTTQSITMWILTEDQYDNFKSGGIDESELNSASLGASGTQVLQRATRTVTGANQFSSGSALALQNYFALNGLYDELRISDSSLNEAIFGATAIPEPGTIATGFLVAVALGSSLIRRRLRRIAA